MCLSHENGFVLVSYVVYVTILVLLMAIAVQLAVLIIPQAYTLIAWCGHTDFYTAYDVLYKDLCCAPLSADHWYKADSDGLIWHTDCGDHGWVIVQKNLVYKEGIYNPNTGMWSCATTSLIAQNVQMDTVIISIQHGVVNEVLCSMHKIYEPAYRWCCRKVFHGAIQ